MKAFHRRSVRLKEYDYSWAGAYFVTICTFDRGHVFGEIRDEESHLSEIGKTAEERWYEIPEHFTDIELGAFVVMPNHVHGIVVLLGNPRRGVQLNAPAETNAPIKNYFSKISPRKNSLGIIIRTYKAAVTMRCRKNGHAGFRWQRSFFDHIIRNSTSFERISNYIMTNPQCWALDRETTQRIGQDDFDFWLDSFRQGSPNIKRGV